MSKYNLQLLTLECNAYHCSIISNLYTGRCRKNQQLVQIPYAELRLDNPIIN